MFTVTNNHQEEFYNTKKTFIRRRVFKRIKRKLQNCENWWFRNIIAKKVGACGDLLRELEQNHRVWSYYIMYVPNLAITFSTYESDCDHELPRKGEDGAFF